MLPHMLPQSEYTSGVDRDELYKLLLYILIFGAPGGIRTHGPQIRNLVLYPAELRMHAFRLGRSGDGVNCALRGGR